MIRVKYTRELLEKNVKDCYSFAELCRRLGLKPEGSNPKTLRKKMDEFGVDYHILLDKDGIPIPVIQSIEVNIYLTFASIVR